ncbi:MAG TPA: 30S ribosomal protein S20, partial [Candidatus Polarisedimenticolia bacterium]|nr:30S ribosomal protein S20 [Candidatus Polarisedimenticolia bacterium]
MGRIQSAIKNQRKNRRRNLINRSRRSSLRTGLRKMRRLVDAKDVKAARAAINETITTIDRAVRKGILHRNAAA